jgi:hypothetical protein
MFLIVNGIKNEIIFDQNIRKWIQILFKLYFETMMLSIGFILNWIQNFKNFGKIKVRNIYFWIWLVNMAFKITFSLENLMK